MKRNENEYFGQITVAFLSSRIQETQWKWGEWIWLSEPSGLHRNSPQGLNISSIRVSDQIRDPEVPITLPPLAVTVLLFTFTGYSNYISLVTKVQNLLESPWSEVLTVLLTKTEFSCSRTMQDPILTCIFPTVQQHQSVGITLERGPHGALRGTTTGVDGGAHAWHVYGATLPVPQCWQLVQSLLHTQGREPRFCVLVPAILYCLPHQLHCAEVSPQLWEEWPSFVSWHQHLHLFKRGVVSCTNIIKYLLINSSRKNVSV